MNFTTTLYNSEVDILNHPDKQSWYDTKITCEISWRMQQDQKDDGISIAWFADEAKLKITELDEDDNEKGDIKQRIHPEENWTIEFEESGLVRGEHFRPTGIIIDFADQKAFSTILREGNDLPF